MGKFITQLQTIDGDLQLACGHELVHQHLHLHDFRGEVPTATLQISSRMSAHKMLLLERVAR